MTALLRVQDLCVHFQTDEGLVKAVDGVSLELAKGEVLGVVGESGSGKSVTALALMGLVPTPPGFYPNGRIEFDGQELLSLKEAALRRLRGNRIAMIFQDPMTSLNPYLRVARQLTEVLEVHRGMGALDARKRAIEMLERVGIPEPARRIDSYPHELSGGMRQRIVIAMALLCEPELLIADEPTTALDVTIQAQILELIGDLRARMGTSVMLITHDLGVVAGMAERVAVMYAGRIVEQAKTADLFASPQHPYTRGLLRATPRLLGARDRLSTIEGLPPDLSDLPEGCPFAPRCESAHDRCEQAYPPKSLGLGGRYTHCWDLIPEGHMPGGPGAGSPPMGMSGPGAPGTHGSTGPYGLSGPPGPIKRPGGPRGGSDG